MTNYPETRASLILKVKDPANQAAWEEFVSLYRPVIYRTAIGRGLQDADANDLAQKVLLAVASAIGRYEKSNDGVRFRHWLRRITRNAIVNALSRKGAAMSSGVMSERELLAELPNRDSGTEKLIQLEYRRELFVRAAEIVRNDVTLDTWQAFELTTIDGLSKNEVAERLGKSIGTIYASRSRVLKRLRDVVEDLEKTHS